MARPRLKPPDLHVHRGPLRFALWYAVAALAWIVSSDQLLGSLDLPHALEVQLSSVKGFLFVVVTAALLYVFASRYIGRVETSEERYFRLFENATEGVTLYRVERDEEGDVSDLVIEDVNPAQIERTGMPRERIVGARMTRPEGVDEELRSYFGAVREAVARDRSLRAEVHVADRDVYTIVSAFPFEKDLWALAETDITQVRHAQQVLREQDERIRQAYEDVLDAVTGGKLVLLAESDLLASLGEPLTDEFEIVSAEELGRARRRIREAVAGTFPGMDVAAVLNSAGEALSNALKHAGGGTCRVFARDGAGQVAVTDSGPGIDFRTLPRATLVPGFSTTATLGMGFTIMLQLCDRILLSTRPGRTVIVLETQTESDGSSRS